MTRGEAEEARADLVAHLQDVRLRLQTNHLDRQTRVELQEEVRELRRMIRSLTSLIGDNV